MLQCGDQQLLWRRHHRLLRYSCLCSQYLRYPRRCSADAAQQLLCDQRLHYWLLRNDRHHDCWLLCTGKCHLLQQSCSDDPCQRLWRLPNNLL